MIKKFHKYLYQILIGIAIVCLFDAAVHIQIPALSTLIEQVDTAIYDQAIAHPLLHREKKVGIAIIDIDTKSMNAEGKWPWPRDKIGQLLSVLKEKGVTVVVMDIVMTEKDINLAKGLQDRIAQLKNMSYSKQFKQTLSQLAPLIDNDKLLANIIAKHEVVLGILFHSDKAASKGALPEPLKLDSHLIHDKLHDFQGYSGSLPLFMEAAHKSGFVSNIPDADGKIRKGILIAKYDGKVYPSLALQAAKTYLLTDDVSLNINRGKLKGITLAGRTIPTTEKGEILMPFYGQAGSLPYFSATDILNNKIPRHALEGRIAIIGSSMILLSDLHTTPLSTVFPGAELIGNMITGIIGQQIILPYSNQTLSATIVIFITGIITAFIFPMVSLLMMFNALLILLFLIFAAFFLTLLHLKIYIPIATLVLILVTQTIINAIYAYLLERQQKHRLSHLFGQYVPENYVQELLDSDVAISMEGEMRDMTALFSDIRQFTTISQSLPPDEVKRLLNTFFTPITKIIFDNKGTIDKYVGDLVMAFWGAPMKDNNHELHAMRAALTMIEKLPEINRQMTDSGLPYIKIGIGIATGPMNVGDMGSEFRRSYTVVGDTVNFASRLENLTKFYGLNILANELLVEKVPDVLWLPVDKVTVKGRTIPETIYQPLGWVDNVEQPVIEMRAKFIEVLNDYYKQNWQKAAAGLEQLLTLWPDHPLFELYLNRINAFKKTPPPEDWQGIYSHDQK